MPIALVEMKLSYDDFMRLTPKRWASLFEAYSNKRKAFWEDLRALIAEQTAWLVNISGKIVKEPVTPAQILNLDGAKKEEPEKPIDWNELESHIGK